MEDLRGQTQSRVTLVATVHQPTDALSELTQAMLPQLQTLYGALVFLCSQTTSAEILATPIVIFFTSLGEVILHLSQSAAPPRNNQGSHPSLRSETRSRKACWILRVTGPGTPVPTG